ncbi:Alanine racemase [hydrothermal vent metagenome]|uniref:Alanine racemase n=1 Tax=hydrothermal vent metagenome TaxID=652676 RepID=A0A1W1EK90_9ZZZZ
MAYITISRDNFHYNLQQINKLVSLDKIAVVLKDNAYGHGLEIIAQLSQEYGIKHSVVKSIKEANIIKEYFETILILNDKPIEDDKFYFAINNIDRLKSANSRAKIELKIDTGMHRNGIDMAQVDEAINIIKENNLNLVGVMSHTKSSDDLSSELFWQEKNFDKVLAKFKAFSNIRTHLYNSSAILRNKQSKYTIIRVGIAIYGYNELSYIFNPIKLKPILSLYAVKNTTRYLSFNNRIGYGGDGNNDGVISTYDIGYGDGWLRDTKDIYIDEDIKIIGRVSMDFISINSKDNELCILNDAQKVAKYCNTISYEIVTNLNANIERRII